MIKFIVALIIVAGLLYGGLMALWRSRHQPMGSPEVLARARQREQELAERERREQEDRPAP